jgi:hypothetical protein
LRRSLRRRYARPCVPQLEELANSLLAQDELQLMKK